MISLQGFWVLFYFLQIICQKTEINKSPGVIICPVRSCRGKTKQLYKSDKGCLGVFKNKHQINGKVFSYRAKAKKNPKNNNSLTPLCFMQAEKQITHRTLFLRICAPYQPRAGVKHACDKTSSRNVGRCQNEVSDCFGSV